MQGEKTAIVAACGLTKRYPKPGTRGETFLAVDRVSLAIEAGEIYGILGPNGAGKTTTLEMIEGLCDIDDGQALVDGIDVSRDPHGVKRVIGVQLQANEYFEHLYLVELLDLFAALYGQHRDPLKILL